MDYRFADSGFFSGTVQDVLEEAASIWEGVIGDDFAEVPSGIPFSISDPSSEGRQEVTLTDPIDDLRVFVGSEADLGESTLAHSAVTGRDAKGDAFNVRISPDFRGQGPVTDFEPYAGSLTFDAGVSWNLDAVNDGEEQYDLLSVALHEVGHILGIGQAPIYNELATDSGFMGSNSQQLNGGDPLPLEPGDDAHVQDGFADESVLMDPTLRPDTRKLPSDYDLAMLADIGYQTDGFVAQGSTRSITTDQADDPVFGTVLDDTIYGGGGDDHIQGESGADALYGEAGEDVLLGQSGPDYLAGGAGADQLEGGPGDDALRGGAGEDVLRGGAGSDAFGIGPESGQDTITDFEVGADTIVIHPDLGYTNSVAILDDITKPYTNVSRIELGPATTLDVYHEETEGTPLTEDTFRIDILDGEDASEPTNQAPEPIDDTATTAFEEAVLIDVLANDSDPDGDTLTLESVVDPANGQANIQDGAIQYIPAAGFTGEVSFTYTVADGAGNTASANVGVDVEARDEPEPPVGTIGFTTEADPILIGQGANYLGQGGEDTYIVSEAVASGGTSVIQDSGSNTVQLVDGVEIAGSVVMADALQLDLANGARVQVLGASEMTYETGGSAEQGTAGTTRDYAAFAEEVLGVSVPEEGQAEGGAVTIGESGSTEVDLSEGDASGTDGVAETFVYEFTVQDGEAVNAGDGTVSLEGFNPDEDTLRFDDLSDTLAGEELSGQEGVTINENPLEDSSDYTGIGFGTDDQGQAGLLELIGILDGDLSETPYEVV